MKQAIKRLAAWGLQNDDNAALKYSFRRRIHRLGREGKINIVYDIGAHHGNWARGIQRLLPGSTFHLFEANPSWRSQLSRSGFSFYLAALSRKKGKKIFYTAESTGDSFYRENCGLTGLSTWQERELDTVDLDSFVRQNGIPSPDWIKLDVQGSELDVLAGGRQTFAHAQYLLCEVPLLPYNEGALSFSDYLAAFADAGFHPVSIVEGHSIALRDGGSALCQIDLFFERSRTPPKLEAVPDLKN